MCVWENNLAMSSIACRQMECLIYSRSHLLVTIKGSQVDNVLLPPPTAQKFLLSWWCQVLPEHKRRTEHSGFLLLSVQLRSCWRDVQQVRPVAIKVSFKKGKKKTDNSLAQGLNQNSQQRLRNTHTRTHTHKHTYQYEFPSSTNQQQGGWVSGCRTFFFLKNFVNYLTDS